MAALAKDGNPSLATPTPPTNVHFTDPIVAGEDLGYCDACTVRADGKAYRASGAAADANARIWGYTPRAYRTGQPVSLYFDVNFHYGAGMVPGTRYYLSGVTPGGLDTVASLGGTVVAAVAVDANKVRVFQTMQTQ